MGGGVSAVRTLQRLLGEDRERNEVEIDQLRRFPGCGATPEWFAPNSNKYAAEREALQEM